MRSATHCVFNVFQETTITEIKQKIMKIPDANGIVIDGFPRDIGQALSFEDQVCFQKCVALVQN